MFDYDKRHKHVPHIWKRVLIKSWRKSHNAPTNDEYEDENHTRYGNDDNESAHHIASKKENVPEQPEDGYYEKHRDRKKKTREF